MTSDTSKHDVEFAGASDISTPLETFNLNHTVTDPETGLHPTAHDRESAPSGVRQSEQIVLEAHPSNDSDNRVSGVSFLL